MEVELLLDHPMADSNVFLAVPSTSMLLRSALVMTHQQGIYHLHDCKLKF